MSDSDITDWLALSEAGHSPATEAAGGKVGAFLCIGHSGGGLSVAALIGFNEDPDNPISLEHCNK